MPNVNLKNELIKRKYFKWLKEAAGFCDSTVNSIEKGILVYEEYTEHEDFSGLTPDKAISFKKWLKIKEHNGKIISTVTCHGYLRNLRKFLTWLCGQAGYKSKIKLDAISYLNISAKDERMATQNVPRDYPALEYVISLADSIKGSTEIELRDRALISFTLLSGMRDTAIASLPIGCFDEENLTISQNPKEGVETKFSKYIPTVLFKFDEKLVNYFLEWVRYLKIKGFGLHDPLFPRCELVQGNDNFSFDSPTEVEPVFWHGAGPIRNIFKKRTELANLQYYPPHTYRHLAVDLAIKNCKKGEQFKAVSQNFGHENIATTFGSYGNYPNNKLSEILKNIDFSGKTTGNENEKLKKIMEILND
jgi:integrase/recombinase XerD